MHLRPFAFFQGPLTNYHWGVLISSMSAGFGLLREVLFVVLLGFSAKNDQLQLYLSIFFTVTLLIDAVRLGTLNLANNATLKELLINIGLLGAPITLLITISYCYLATNLDYQLLIGVTGSCVLNLLAAAIITYKQRLGAFIATHLVNNVVNVILIPGILAIFYLHPAHPVNIIVWLFCSVPVVQVAALLFVKTPQQPKMTGDVTRRHSLVVFSKQGATVLGDQCLQIILRAAFYHLGTGYLTAFSLLIRIFTTLKTIFVDTYIGVKISQWQHKKQAEQEQGTPFWLSKTTNALILLASTLLLVKISNSFVLYNLQLAAMLIPGFYFTTIVRTAYYKINNHHYDNQLIHRYIGIEAVLAILAFALYEWFAINPLILLWLWFVIKPYLQLFIIETKLVTMKNEVFIYD
jgi:hypothetical protein